MIQALTKLDPIQQYYVNDHYLHSISARDFKNNQSYSPKALIQGYWKKDYQTFIMLNTSNEDTTKFNLPTINTKQFQSSYSKMQESNIERNLAREFNLQQYKIKPACNNSCSIRKQKEDYKLPGRLIKGSFPHTNKIMIRDHKKYNGELSIEHLEIKQVLSPKQLFQSSPPSNTSLENQLNALKTLATPIKKVFKPQLQKPLSPIMIPQEIKIRKQYINTIELKQNYIKLTNTTVNNVMIIQFDELLGFNENSYYGLQTDFIQSELYTEYQHTKEHYFQRINNHSSIYILKNLKEMFLSLSKLYQIVLLTKHHSQDLIDYINERKLPVSSIYSFKPSSYTHIRALECHQILDDLLIKKYNKISLIQTYESTETLSNILIEQSLLYPFADGITSEHFNLLLFPSLCMYNLIKPDSTSSKTFLHSLYFIEQFGQSILVDNVLHSCTDKIHKLDGQTQLNQLQEKINQQIDLIGELKQTQSITQPKYSKKEMASRISEKFETVQNIKELSQELVFRNKQIIKRVLKYKQESVNLLQNVKEQLEKEQELITYCQTLLSNFYYIQF